MSFIRKLEYLKNRFEKKRCKICKSKAVKKENAYSRVFYECKNCGFIFVGFYDVEKLKKGMDISMTSSGGYREYHLVKMLSRDLNLKSILLYGTGDTNTFMKLRIEGYDVIGVDINKALIAKRKEEYGMDSFFHENELSNNTKYDIITCVEVLEHFIQPKDSLDILTSLLSRNGVICGTTNLYPGYGNITEVDDNGYMSHGSHVSFWSKKSLNHIAEMYNLKLKIFKLVNPGSGIPGKVSGNWPNKRVFFLYDKIHSDYFNNLLNASPTLPIDKA
jgi:2-polyprenyl-3-methyl-5-hydroxy-6-metoxy-1,4-benzoquinol methylase